MRHSRRSAILTLLLVAAVAVTSCAAPVASARAPDIGMCVRMQYAGPAEIEQQFGLMAQMNVKLVRVDFDWSAIEGQRGRYNWSYTDRMVDAARARNMRVVALMSYTPGWARPPGTDSHTPPLSDADFGGFARAAASRYAPLGVRDWEIWNEPNSSDYWVPKPDVEKYGTLFRAAAEAIRGVDATATLITGGLTRGTDTPDGRRLAQATFVDAMYRNGIAQTADAIAVHPYSFPALPVGVGPVGGFAELPELHALMQRWGDADKKIWITEFGAPTGNAPEAMSERDQAATLTAAGRMAESWDWLGPLIFYELKDAGTDPTDLEQNFGMVRADLSLKDAGKSLLD